MATLVQFLAAGVNGASNGTATFFLRGTVSSALAVMYNEFEALTQPPSNVIDLDANGAAEIYVDAYVDVTIANSAGTDLRTVTVGNSAPLVEVQSPSFTGTDYDGSPANTAGEPITLKAILDKWIQSAGSTNWQVLVGGVATDIDSAFASFAGMFVNVKDPAYGATGDGVTDDTTAIASAHASANGGILFFPPGTYRVTTLTLSGNNVFWMGSGCDLSIISGTTEASLIVLPDPFVGVSRFNFRDIGFTSSGTYARLVLMQEDQSVSFHNCSFDTTNTTGSAINSNDEAGLSTLLITGCDFLLGSTSSACILNEADPDERFISIKGSTFEAPAGFTGIVLQGPDMTVEGCRFDASAVVTGTYYMVSADNVASPGIYVGTFTGNTFIDGGSDGFAFDLRGVNAGAQFTEDNNTFIGFVAPATLQDPGHIYDASVAGVFSGDTVVRLGSRRGRKLNIEATDTPIELSACLEAEYVCIEATSTAGISFTVPALIAGLSGWVTLTTNHGGGAVNYSFSDSAGDGPEIDLDNGGNETLTLGGGPGSVFSAHYYTTVLPDGTLRSLVTTEVVHI